MTPKVRCEDGGEEDQWHTGQTGRPANTGLDSTGPTDTPLRESPGDRGTPGMPSNSGEDGLTTTELTVQEEKHKAGDQAKGQMKPGPVRHQDATDGMRQETGNETPNGG